MFTNPVIGTSEATDPAPYSRAQVGAGSVAITLADVEFVTKIFDLKLRVYRRA